MRNVLFACFVFLNLFSCNSQSSKYQQQFIVTQSFLNKLKVNDSLGIRDMIGLKLSDISKDEGTISFEVNQLYKLIQLHGLPNKNTYQLVEYPPTDARLLDITMPLGKDSLKISFVKYLPLDKVADYYWHRHIRNDNLITLPPDSIKY